MATFSPVNLELLEFVGTTGTSVQIIPATAVPPALQDSLTITNVIFNNPKIPGDLHITWSGDTFTFSSKFEDYFERTFKYLIYSENATKLTYSKKYYEVHRFADIPPNTGLYQYVPPSQDYLELDFDVYTHGTVSGNTMNTWVLVLRYNYTYSNARWVTEIKKCSEYVVAKKSYPEL